jgi:hypothetical protein
MAKISISKAALSHAKAYARELIRNIGYDSSEQREFEKKINDIKTIKELVSLHFSFRDYHKVDEFYKAMIKVCKHLRTKDDNYEHGGTECRGWYRVWGGEKCNTGYFCRFDLGRDQYMAQTFNDVGAFSDSEMRVYKTKMTLNQALSCVGPNGIINVDDMMKYWKPECQEQVFDIPLLNAMFFVSKNVA